MKILITGSNGLLGQKLVALLGKSDHKILASGQGPCRILDLPSNVRYESCDITKPSDLNQCVLSFKPDVVIHSAAMTNVDECELNSEKCQIINVDATRNVVNSCNQINSHLIHLSTDFIFDGKEGPYTEDGVPNPISIYGQSKLDAEKVVAVPNASLNWISHDGLAWKVDNWADTRHLEDLALDNLDL